MLSTLLLSRQSALLFVMILLGVVTAPVSSGRGSAAEAVGASESRTVALNSQTFNQNVKAGSGDWVVVFCADSAEPCAHMLDSFRHLTIIWEGTGQFPEARFGEVNCDQDRDMCDKEGVVVAPNAIHYRNGVRMSSWAVNGEDVSMIRQFVGWVKDELTPDVMPDMVHDPSSTDSDKGAALPFDFSAPFAGMDSETAAVGCVLVLGAIAVVGWVLVEGFELLPAKGKEVAM